MMPAVSLIIPAYNRERFIAAAVGSVLRQTERDFELIVYDDGSTDDTIKVAREAAGGDPRVHIIAGEHRGVCHAINAAAKLATGTYLGQVDSDDGLVPQAVAETRACLDAHPNVGMVYTDYLTLDEDGNVLGQGQRTKTPYSRDRLLIDFMTFHFRLMRREVFWKVGGMDESHRWAEDYDLCLRLSEITEIHHLPRPLYLYRVHRSTTSHERRLDQIMASKDAIERALKRRGMAAKYELDLELVGRFRLRQKKQGGAK
jgi:glycosyltransferase involved in cell wall biosynthesis